MGTTRIRAAIHFFFGVIRPMGASGTAGGKSLVAAFKKAGIGPVTAVDAHVGQSAGRQSEAPVAALVRADVVLLPRMRKQVRSQTHMESKASATIRIRTDQRSGAIVQPCVDRLISCAGESFATARNRTDPGLFSGMQAKMKLHIVFLCKPLVAAFVRTGPGSVAGMVAQMKLQILSAIE